MARVVYSALIDNIRGSIGGTTFQRNRYGYTVKKKPSMVRPNTPRQGTSKLIMSQVVRSWRDLTASQRTAYETYASSFPQYAKHAPTVALTGYGVFVKYNTLRLLQGGSVLTTITQAIPATDTLSYTITRSGTALNIAIVSANDDEEWLILFFMSRPLGPTEKFFGSKTKYVDARSNADLTFDVASEYSAIYGLTPSSDDLIGMDVLLIGDNSPYVLARDDSIYTVL